MHIIMSQVLIGGLSEGICHVGREWSIKLDSMDQNF